VATANNAAVTGERSATPAPSREVVRILVTKGMKQMADRRGLDVDKYLEELATADLATFRSLSFVDTGRLAKTNGHKKIAAQDNDFHRTKMKLSPEHCDKIRDQLADGITLATIARNFGVAQSTIRRTLAQEKEL
jgi:hypothetical protein